MKKQMVKIIEEICKEEKIKLKKYSQDFFLELTKNGQKMFICRNRFPNTSASSEIICSDKAGVSTILSENNIPNVLHKIFISPEKAKNLSLPFNWNDIYRMLDEYKVIVCKPNHGTGGVGVIKAQNRKQLKKAATEIFRTTDIAICPFCEIDDEYRVVMLKNDFQYAFRKIRPYVIGNGTDCVKTLWEEQKNNWERAIIGDVDWRKIPAKNEKYYLSWKHNLGQGAKPELVTDEALKKKLSEIAKKCVKTLSLGFVSIDIVKIDGQFKVLEINSGIMIDTFSAYCQEYYNKAKSAIKNAVLDYFNNK